MKDVNDPGTIDFIAPGAGIVRQRGRPATGNAMTGAERQKARRDRLKASGFEEITVSISSAAASALRKYIQFKDMTPGDAVDRIIKDRLLRPR